MIPLESGNESREAEAVSLEDLAKAFAAAMGEDIADAIPEPEAPRDAPQSPEDGVTDRAAAEEDEAILAGPTSADAEGRYVNPAGVLEALLFVGDPDGKSLNPSLAAELMRGVTPSEVARLTSELNDRYRRRGCAYRVVFEDGGYRMKLLDEYAALRNAFFGPIRPIKLSRQAIDVLAVVAYRQPITVQEVNRTRGKPSGAILAQLVRRDLLCVGQEDGTGPRKAPQYRTTQRFLELFGLRSLDELPQIGGPLPHLDGE